MISKKKKNCSDITLQFLNCVPVTTFSWKVNTFNEPKNFFNENLEKNSQFQDLKVS